MVYRTLDRMEAAELKATLREAEQYLATIDTL
jgi:hypothetical protein